MTDFATIAINTHQKINEAKCNFEKEKQLAKENRIKDQHNKIEQEFYKAASRCHNKIELVEYLLDKEILEELKACGYTIQSGLRKEIYPKDCGHNIWDLIYIITLPPQTDTIKWDDISHV